MSPIRYYLLILLIHLIKGLNVDQYIPTDVNCEVIHSIANPLDEKKLRVSWYLDHHSMSHVRRFDLSCDCIISGDLISEKVTHHCSPPCSYQVSRNSCYDKCQCRIISIVRRLLSPTVKSNFTTCYIGPTAPKEPPVIVSHPTRNDDGNSIEIIFKLPTEDLYCDSTDVINSITVNVTDHVGGLYQYNYDLPSLRVALHTDGVNYNFTFQAEHHQFWRPFNITISVNNSVGSSPFSDHMIVRGADNGDITRNDYELEFYYDGNVTPKVSTLQFYWNLSRKAQHIMDSQFITGFKIIVEHVSGNDTISTTSLTKNLTLNITLEPHQWYSIIGRILTKDNDTWGPEPVYEYFQTSDLMSTLPVQSTSSSNNYRVLTILLSFIIFLTILVVTMLLYITRIHTNVAKLCFKDYDNVDDNDSYTDKMNEVIGQVAESYAEYQCDQSTVENNDFYHNNNENDSSYN